MAWAWALRRISGAAIPTAVQPLVAGSMLQSIATSGFSSYVAIWAVTELGASSGLAGVALFLRAGLGVVTGYVGGAWSDRVGRRPVILTGWLAQALCVASFAFVGGQVWLGLGLMVMFGPLGPPAGAAAAAYIADVVEPAELENAIAGFRAASSVASMTGPAIAAVLVIGDAWPRMFTGLGVCSLVAVILTARRLRSGSVIPPEPGPVDGGKDDDQERGHVRDISLWTDHRYLVFLVAAALITLSMAGTDRVLPISAVDSYGVTAAAWGAFAVLGPLMVVLLQGRITAWSLSWSRRARILIAAGLTGLPFLLLIVAGDGLTVAVVLVLSVVGEMLWVPTAQGIAADMAPATRRGAHLGAFGGATSLSYAVAPLVALELRGQAGNDAMWIMFAVVAVIGAIAGVPAVRRRASG